MSRFPRLVAPAPVQAARHLAEPAAAPAVRRIDGPDDAALVARILAGDRWAEEALYRRYVDLVLATAVRLLRQRTEAEDVAQETFLIAFESLGKLRDPGALRGWLVRIVVSRVHRRFRWRKVRRLFGVRDEEDAMLADAASDEATPEMRAELAELDRMLARLPEKDRVAWTLRHVVGLQLDEVADACACSLATAKRRIGAAHVVIAAQVGLEVRDGE